jgi:hypothetical protein
MKTALGLLALIGFGLLIGQEKETPQPFIFTGQAWVEKWTPEMRNGYMDGYVDGYDFAATMTETAVESELPQNQPKGQTVVKMVRYPLQCFQKMRIGQMVAIVDKAIKDHPEKWNQSIASFVDLALAEACN